MFCFVQERRRLKERFPSLALVASDEEQCQILLNSYQGLLLNKDLCEGKCALGEVCPTGLCRSPSKRYVFVGIVPASVYVYEPLPHRYSNAVLLQ